MNERPVRHPHALDPGHDLRVRRLSLTILTAYPLPLQYRTVSDALTASNYPPQAIRMPLLRCFDVRSRTLRRNWNMIEQIAMAAFLRYQDHISHASTA